MTLEQARCVVEVASCGKIREAANNLYISPSAVSQSISALETELGFRIFSRSRTGSSLTAVGSSVYALCVKITQGMDEIRHLSRSGLSAESAEIIRIGLCNFAQDTQTILMELAREYHVSVHHCAITDMEYLMNNGFLDVALCSSIRPTFLRHKQEFQSQLINHIDLVLTMRKGNPLTAIAGPTMEPEKLTNSKWGFLNPDIDRLLAACIPNYRVHNMVYVSNHVEDVVNVVRNSDLLTLLPPALITNDLATYNLYIGETRPPRLYNYILYGKGLEDNQYEKNSRIRGFAERLVASLRGIEVFQ